MHTLTFVLVPESARDIRDEVEFLLAGSNLDSDREYPTYHVLCSCIGRKAFDESIRSIDESPRGITWLERLKAARAANDATLEQGILRERLLAVRELELQHPAYDQIDPRCSWCSGTGKQVQSRDPAQHHDWWVIGGRWSGYFSDAPDVLDEDGDSYRGNVARMRDVSPETLPAAMVTAEGHYHEGPGLVTDLLEEEELPPHDRQERQRWRQEVAEIYARHPNHFVVVVDVHL